MTIDPPQNAAFGYYYAVVFSRDGPQPKVQGKQTNLLGSVATLILLDVQAPGAVRKSDIVEFSTDSKSYEFLPATFGVRMYNTGNTHVAPRGNILITKGDQRVALLEVNQAKGNILPKTYRKYTTQWTDGTPSYKEVMKDDKAVLQGGRPYTPLTWSNFNMSKLRFGKYNARLVMVYNDGKSDVAVEAKLSFWVIPWRIIIGVLVVGLLLLAGLWVTLLRPIRRRFSKKKGNARLR